VNTIENNINDISKILKQYKNIAVVGMSRNKLKPSYRVAEYLRDNGYQIFPVNPNYDKIMDIRCYSDLTEIEEKIDIVNIFRRPEHVLPVVVAAIQINAPVVWMQLRIINNAAEKLAKSAGLQIIMDRCLKIEHQRLI